MKVLAARLAGAVALSFLLAPPPAPAAAPAGRYTATGGIVKDNKTGLYWQQVAAPMQYNFGDAVAYCSANVAALSGTGWRLPAIKELQTLVDDSVPPPSDGTTGIGPPTIDSVAFPAAPAGGFWSSTRHAQSPSSDAWYVDFQGGFGGGRTNSWSMTMTLFVRCVR